MPVDDEVDALYTADPDEFVAARQALVKRLRSEGDKERAAEVAKLRRPTAAAWAVNQLARRHPDEVAGLVELGQELHRAHERLLSGGRDDATVTSGRRRREAIADLVERAAGLLAESGRAADAHRDAIASTLDAASLDPAVGEDVIAGRLSKELDPPSGFGLGEAEMVWAPAPPTAEAGRAAPAARTAPSSAAASRSDGPTKKAGAGGKAEGLGKAEGRGKAGGLGKAGAAEKPAAPDDRAERAAAERARRAEEVRRRASAARAAATRARDLADQAQDAADHAERERERLEDEVVRARRTATDARRAARELRDAAREAERQAAALESEAAT